jgi:hypothetical protein
MNLEYSEGFARRGSDEALSINAAFYAGFSRGAFTRGSNFSEVLSFFKDLDSYTLYLFPIQNLESFYTTLRNTVEALPWVLPFDATRTHTLFCPGCKLLVADWRVVWEHIGTADHKLERQAKCYEFAEQVERLGRLLRPRNTAARRCAILNDLNNYIAGYNPRIFLCNAGDASEWMHENIPEAGQLYHCPLCHQVFTCSIAVTVHLQQRIERSKANTCVRATETSQFLDLQMIDHVYTRKLLPGNITDLAFPWFRSTLRWANLISALLLIKFAKRQAWRCFGASTVKEISSDIHLAVLPILYSRLIFFTYSSLSSLLNHS